MNMTSIDPKYKCSINENKFHYDLSALLINGLKYFRQNKIPTLIVINIQTLSGVFLPRW